MFWSCEEKCKYGLIPLESLVLSNTRVKISGLQLKLFEIQNFGLMSNGFFCCCFFYFVRKKACIWHNQAGLLFPLVTQWKRSLFFHSLSYKCCGRNAAFCICQRGCEGIEGWDVLDNNLCFSCRVSKIRVFIVTAQDFRFNSGGVNRTSDFFSLLCILVFYKNWSCTIRLRLVF